MSDGDVNKAPAAEHSTRVTTPVLATPTAATDLANRAEAISQQLRWCLPGQRPGNSIPPRG